MNPSTNSTIKPYNDVDAKKNQVTTMFDKIAPYYDFLNKILSAGVDGFWRRKAIASLTGVGTDNWLDIATGTADLAIESAIQFKPKAIIGMDISPNMLEIGRKKIENKALTSIITLEVGDSEALRFSDGSFDVVTASFGVRNFENLQKGLSEMFRVLKNGGKVMILEFSRPTRFPIKNLFQIYFKYLLPVIGRIKSKDQKAYTYLYESVQSFPDYERFASILQDTGFIKVTFKPLTFGICTIYLAEKK